MSEYLTTALVAAALALLTNALYPKMRRIVEKRLQPRRVKVRVPQDVAVVDASNVVMHGPKVGKKGRIENLLVVINALRERGFEVYAIADASLRHKVDKPEVLERLIAKGVVLQAPASTPADYFILSVADREYGIVVSNDVFKEWRTLFPWIKDKYRLVRYMIVGKTAYFYPDVRPKKKRKKVKEEEPLCPQLFKRSEEDEDYSKYYVM
ncbi:hypothetical protein Igni_0753 [Ignicoccus hospitalis KIN4/I]|uniref:RNase NYN domain-containing protein n=1 Tax=Ignicoccus hospitalis (strain KIN4/I / DSM 18386 / JCM 14125) TaxID=453591 RepID=A8AAI3_IGNH4|nr:hypothetical protein Igni_0753 [Ignicoccus hospitalis KIN4/I]